MLTYEQNIKAVLECIFAGYKDELIEDACRRICALSRSEIPNTCGDAISRQAVLEEIAMLKKSPWFNENTYGSKVIRKEAVEIVEDVCIKREPSVTPQQRTGRWIERSDIIGKWYECDQCHTDWGGPVNFCPNCGAKMEVEE